MTGKPVHSKLGASSAHRWMSCPGSVKLSEGLPNPTSVHAAEGQVAHALAAALLTGEPAYEIGAIVEQEGHPIEVTQEMYDAVDVYVSVVREDSVEVYDHKMFVETGFHLKALHDDLYGTSDCAVLFPYEKLLRVYDYKHGAGVPVEVLDNPQLLYYALGALLQIEDAKVRTIEIVVVQPRCSHPDGPIRRQVIGVADLLDFATDLLAAVKVTEAPNAPLRTGDHCRWCKAAGICPELTKESQLAAKAVFDPVAADYGAVLSKALAAVPAIEAWIEGVRSLAYAQAERGRCPENYKLVAKRATRKWLDAEDAAKTLAKLLSKKEIYAPKELLSPAQVEKKLPKAQKKLLEPLVTSISSGNTLVHVSDPRPEVKILTAEQVFTPIAAPSAFG